MTSEWIWDDASTVPDDEQLLRRVRRIPDCVVPNLTTRTAELKAGALIFDDGDGMSVHQDSIRGRLNVPRAEICDWELYHAIEFEASVVREAECFESDQSVRAGGVVHQDDGDDDVLGMAHALVRTRSAGLPRGQKRAIRDQIVDHHRWVQEDPNCPG